MNRSVRLLGRLVHALLLLAGLLAGTALALQFTNLPWRAYRYLSEIPAGCPAPPSHILVMGGSGIPGPSGLMRTFYAARAAAEHPAAAYLTAAATPANRPCASPSTWPTGPTPAPVS